MAGRKMTGMQTTRTHKWRLPRRPRLFAAGIIGVAIAALLPQTWELLVRVLVAWNIAVWSYLLMILWLVSRAGHATVREIAAEEDETALAVVIIVSTAALFSLAGVIMDLGHIKSLPSPERAGHYLMVISTVLASWFLVGVVFAIHYAHMFYSADGKEVPLKFPDHNETPDYWDFLYFAFTIAVAAQTSDVSICSKAVRKAVTCQSILSYFFSTAVIGLTINITAGLVGG
jgi:uncharacterized membrane protein